MRLLSMITMVALGSALAACSSDSGGSGGGGGGTGTGTGTGGAGTGTDTTGTGQTGTGTTGTDTTTGTGTGGGDACPDDTPNECADGLSCIADELVCDGVEDCDDGSDESEATCGGDCTDGQAECDDGALICGEWICDGEADCSAGEDEIGCGECTEGEAECADGAIICGEWICDGEADCSEGEDEVDCGGDGDGFICDSGVPAQSNDQADCLEVACCAEANFCSTDGADVQACADCIAEQGGPLCDDLIACAIEFDCL